MIISFRYGEAKVLPTQKVMIFYYFTVESLISLLATNKKFLAGKNQKNLKRFSTEYFFFTCFEPYFLEDPHQQTTQPSLQGQDYEKQQN